MSRGIDIANLTLEFVRYLLKAKSGRVEFRDVVLERILDGRVRDRSRPFFLSYVLVSALEGHAYKTALQTLKQCAGEISWAEMSAGLLRTIFEVALISDEMAIAQRAVNQLSSERKLSMSDIDNLRCLIAWRSGGLENESAIDLSRIYFAAFPEYDEYFKGRICLKTGRLSEAKDHFRRCLALAPLAAAEFRQDVTHRLQAL